jgi:HD superfamily phosphodiesterase
MMYRNSLISELESHFGYDGKRIKHALTVLGFAESILEKELGNPEVVTPAAILHDVGIKEAERKYNSSAAKYQEIEGPPIARRIMKKLNIANEIIDEVCEIIAHHHTPGIIDTLNFNVLWDADLITNMKEEGITIDKQKIKKLFKTNEGKKIAEREIFKKGEIE